MRIPFSEIAKAIGAYQSINKPIGEYPNESESALLRVIAQQENSLQDKKAEICALREELEYLKEVQHAKG
tara:strand:- start:91 stop:300 length:210 start_codon:yes stop_codon:yes gene_type:complete